MKRFLQISAAFLVLFVGFSLISCSTFESPTSAAQSPTDTSKSPEKTPENTSVIGASAVGEQWAQFIGGDSTAEWLFNSLNGIDRALAGIPAVFRSSGGSPQITDGDAVRKAVEKLAGLESHIVKELDVSDDDAHFVNGEFFYHKYGSITVGAAMKNGKNVKMDVEFGEERLLITVKNADGETVSSYFEIDFDPDTFTRELCVAIGGTDPVSELQT